jgi:hypothetical protein
MLTARRIADLGPLAARHADHLAQVLRGQSVDWWSSWASVEAAHAHWRLTSEPELCIAVFSVALDPLHHGRQIPVSRQALRYLPALGAAAGPFLPLLNTIVDRDQRLTYSGGWRAIAEDDLARALASTAIQAITA